MNYFLPLDEKPQDRLAIAWLYVAVGFLLASGVYPLLLALARTSYDMPWKDFFYTALVLHVDFTVLWWLLAIAGVFWSLNSSSRAKTSAYVALMLVIAGGVLVAISPLTGAANPLTNNYVPMLENHFFIKGMIVFGGGILILALRGIFVIPWRLTFRDDAQGTLRFAVWSAAVATLLAIVALAWSWFQLPMDLQHRAYYEPLFWAGGHILQYTHTALLSACWLWLMGICGFKSSFSNRIIFASLAFSLVLLFFAFIPFVQYRAGDPEFTLFFVRLMEDGNGVTPFVVGLAVIWAILKSPTAGSENRHLYLGLLSSLLLFAVGGVISLFIGASSTLITAHYHGSTVSITMAFMAMTYYWLPGFGFGRPNLKWARVQIYAYAFGQLLHIAGLAWGGGYGMKRKILGTTQDLQIHTLVSPQDLIGVGGVVSVLSGILFAVVVLPVMLRGRKTNVKQFAKGESHAN